MDENNDNNKIVKDSNLVWIDLEMTGLDPDQDEILEIASIVTNSDLEIIATGPVIVIHHDDNILNAMDDWNQKHHGESGLIKKVKASSYTTEMAEQETLEFLKKFVGERESPLCGNSIGQDRRFIIRYMKKLDEYLHYRNIDVSSFKEMVYRWYPQFPEFPKKNLHTALEDIQESIAELQYYRKHFFPCDERDLSVKG